MKTVTRVYRCVYCGNRFFSYAALSHHDSECKLKYVQHRQWARAIAQAKLREKRASEA